MKAVILAGGRGTRFWPRSTEAKPKQFLPLTSERDTMLQQTYLRFRSFLPEEDIYIVTCASYLSLVQEQLPGLGVEQVILEPEQRDTGPCVALTARYFLQRGMDEVIVTAPSDQYIPEAAELHLVLLKAEQAAKTTGIIVTLGVVPTRPETGFGYIMAKEASVQPGASLIQTVEAFIEKPALPQASELCKNPNVYWNSGICVWKPSTIAGHLANHQPLMWNLLQQSQEQLHDAYAALPKISVDFAILEKVKPMYTIPIKFTWDDIGTWTALERAFTADASGNIVEGEDGLTIMEETENCIIYMENKKAIVLGVHDLIIVSTDEGILICHKTKEAMIKHVLNKWI